MNQTKLQIVLVEPFFTGSHRLWAEEYQRQSKHQITLLSLEGRYWKWRMHGGAVTLANRLNQGNLKPDLCLCTDMLDLNLFRSLTHKQFPTLKSAIYFHENQLNYPWSPTDQDIQLKRDNHYAFINYTSALGADAVYFNSHYHQNAFLNELPKFLKSFPDYPELWSVDTVKAKSRVLPLGMELSKFDQYQVIDKQDHRPLLVWNHRWEYDKNPEAFFQALFQLSDEGLEFDLAVLGESYRKSPKIFEEAKLKLAPHIIQWGYVSSFEAYASWLWRADILPVSAIHDFFGASVVQAIYCNCYPILPKRLAYPEHLPQHKECFYEDENEFISKLRAAITNLPVNYKRLRESVRRYDWSEMVGKYDQEMEQLMIAT
ncbi:MAG: tRNA-queuosine alpha-mannosyltransferase domain-containing protein [Flammeovirgaceae bacterium]